MNFKGTSLPTSWGFCVVSEEEICTSYAGETPVDSTETSANGCEGELVH